MSRWRRGLVTAAALLAVLGGASGSASGQVRHGGRPAGRHVARHHRRHRRRAPRLIAQPSAQHPLTLLEIGDSLGEDLGIGLQNLLASHRDVRVLARAVGDTGLANVNYYDWARVLSTDLRVDHPGLLVVFIGGNDVQGFDVGNRPAFFGTAFWHTEYSDRVATILHEAAAVHVPVLWVGMPIMQSPTFSAGMEKLNAIYRAEVAHDNQARFLSTWKLFSNAAGQYAAELPGPGGALVTVRDPDGVHIAPPAGDDRVAAAVIQAIEKDFSIRL